MAALALPFAWGRGEGSGECWLSCIVEILGGKEPWSRLCCSPLHDWVGHLGSEGHGQATVMVLQFQGAVLSRGEDQDL